MSGGLTRDEARRRALTVAVHGYDVELDLTTGPETFRSRTVVTFAATEGASTFLDLTAARVASIELNGRPLVVDAAFDGHRIELQDLAADNVLTVVATCRYSTTGEGLHRFVDPVDGRTYLYTQFEPFDAHRVLACFDQPDLKAPWQLTVRCPEDWVVLSTTTPSRDAEVWHFPVSAPISTYLYSVVAGPYASVDAEHQGIPLGLHCRVSLLAHLDADELFTLTSQGLDLYRERFGSAYPFGKYDQVFVPEHNVGGMENVACVTLTENLLFRSEVTSSQRMRRAEVLLHELAHMWFGNLVTMRWWDDLWLNEAFATWVSVHALSVATDHPEPWSYFCDAAKTSARSADQLPSTHPVVADCVDLDAAVAAFDGITYAKGAAAIQQLVAWVGQETFFDGLRGYLREHAFGNAELADLLRHLEKSSGRDLSTWRDSWLMTTGVNTLRPVVTVVDGAYTAVEVEQDEPHRPHRVDIGLYRRTGGSLTRHRTVEVDVTGAVTPVLELVGEEVADLVLVNAGDLTYAKTRLDPASWHTLCDHLHEIQEPLARAVCWGAAWDMTRDAEVPVSDFLTLVRRSVASETDVGVVERVLSQARTAIVQLGASQLVPERLADLSRTARALSLQPSDRQLAFTRCFVENATTPGDLTDLLDGHPDEDLRWSAVRRLAALGALDREQLEVEADGSAHERLQLLSALAARPTEAAKAEAWGQLDALTSHHEVMAVVEGFVQLEQAELLAPYIAPFYDALTTRWAERAETSLTVPFLVKALFPTWDVSAAGLARVDDALARWLPTPLQRVLRDCRDDLSRASRCRALDTALEP